MTTTRPGPRAARMVEVDGDAIRRLRLAAGYGQAELASLIPLTNGYLSKLERRVHQRVKPATYRRICELLQVQLPEQEPVIKLAAAEGASAMVTTENAA